MTQHQGACGRKEQDKRRVWKECMEESFMERDDDFGRWLESAAILFGFR